MKGILVVSGIGVVVLPVLLAWGAIAGIGFVWNSAPRRLEGSERLAAKAEVFFKSTGVVFQT